ncbi:MAG TPA: ATP-binding cassette domain-containing protein, partial [Nitrospiria bacterium]|nr:ATP-binding cassette domain-containing protein [Nitrospiria bacterium]
MTERTEKRMTGGSRSGFRLNGAGYRYPGRADWAVRDVTLTITPGERIGLIGSNGSGKSTLLKLLAGFLRPQQGEVCLDGGPVESMAAWQLAQQVAVVPQSVQFIFPFTVREI